jgi:hypothetical protein
MNIHGFFDFFNLACKICGIEGAEGCICHVAADVICQGFKDEYLMILNNPKIKATKPKKARVSNNLNKTKGKSAKKAN